MIRIGLAVAFILSFTAYANALPVVGAVVSFFIADAIVATIVESVVLAGLPLSGTYLRRGRKDCV